MSIKSVICSSNDIRITRSFNAFQVPSFIKHQVRPWQWSFWKKIYVKSLSSSRNRHNTNLLEIEWSMQVRTSTLERPSTRTQWWATLTHPPSSVAHYLHTTSFAGCRICTRCHSALSALYFPTTVSTLLVGVSIIPHLATFPLHPLHSLPTYFAPPSPGSATERSPSDWDRERTDVGVSPHSDPRLLNSHWFYLSPNLGDTRPLDLQLSRFSYIPRTLFPWTLGRPYSSYPNTFFKYLAFYIFNKYKMLNIS